MTFHSLNYVQQSKQQTLTAKELHDKLGQVIADGNGLRPVFIMSVTSGLTQAQPILDCFPSQPYDGEVVWLA